MTAEGWPHGDPRDAVRAILADPRFTGTTSAQPPAPTVWDRIVHWFGDRLRDLFGAIGHVLGANNPWTTVVAAVVVLALAAALAYLAFRLAARVAAARSAKRQPSHGAPLAGETSAAGLRDAAFDAARQGRYRDAAALLFASALRGLEEAGRVAYDPTRTAGEYRRLVRDPAFDALANGAVVALFDAAEPQADLFARMASAYDRFFAGDMRA